MLLLINTSCKYPQLFAVLYRFLPSHYTLCRTFLSRCRELLNELLPCRRVVHVGIVDSCKRSRQLRGYEAPCQPTRCILGWEEWGKTNLYLRLRHHFFWSRKVAVLHRLRLRLKIVTVGAKIQYAGTRSA